MDIKTYDLGTLYLCVSGFTGAVPCGELYVDYTVVLNTPQTSNTTQSATWVSAAGLAAGTLVGTADSVAKTGLLDVSLTSASTLTFNQNYKGLYVLTLVGTGLVTGGFGFGASTVTANLNSQCYDAAGTGAVICFYVSALKGQTLIPQVTATTVTSVNWRIGAYNNA
jgi:hypothetical protein